MAARVSITGASGLVGRPLVTRLLQRGVPARVLARRPESAPSGVEIVVGDLRDRAARAALVQGADVVVHCAALMAHDDAAVEIRAVNEEATGELIEQARAADVRRFVFVSSVAVYGEGDLLDVREERPLQPRTAYARSKVAIELALRDVRDMEWVVLRPCTIYGPGGQRLLPYFERLVRSGSVPLVRGGRTLFDLVHAGDVAQALELAAVVPAAAGQAINVAEGVPRTSASILALLGRVLGVEPRTVRVPYTIARGVNGAAAFARRVLRSTAPPPFDPIALDALREHRHFDIERARRVLGFAPLHPLEQGLAEAFGVPPANPTARQVEVTVADAVTGPA